MRRIALMLALTTAPTSCLITRTEEVRVPTPLTAPRIRDIQGLTTPRLGASFEIDEVDNTTVVFRVPVDDDGVNDLLQWRFFVNDDRDCVPQDGGSNCEPVNQPQAHELPPNGTRRREIRETISGLVVGCNRVELYVSSRLRLSGNYRTPEREDDVDFSTWWIYVRARTGGGGVNPVKRCPFRLNP